MYASLLLAQAGKGGGIDLGGALVGALIGAIIGGGVGLILYIVRSLGRKKPPTDDDDK